MFLRVFQFAPLTIEHPQESRKHAEKECFKLLAVGRI
jgi:hypothetical protein